jgi:hypothetical protein
MSATMASTSTDEGAVWRRSGAAATEYRVERRAIVAVFMLERGRLKEERERVRPAQEDEAGRRRRGRRERVQRLRKPPTSYSPWRRGAL